MLQHAASDGAVHVHRHVHRLRYMYRKQCLPPGLSIRVEDEGSSSVGIEFERRVVPQRVAELKQHVPRMRGLSRRQKDRSWQSCMLQR